LKPSQSQQFRSLLAGGLLPVIIFALIEDHFGTLWGLVAGMIFGIGEILWEASTLKRVDPLTWGGNGMLLVLGSISLMTQEGIWFKLQPALIEAGTAAFLWGSVILKKSLLLSLAQKKGGLPQDFAGMRPGVEKVLRKAFQGLTIRLGLFFAIHAGLAVWAALKWSTSDWAILKGVGLTVSLIVYLVVESLVLRYRISTIP
jgi:intracellular septation protein